jgi:prefoldin beta subunit
LLAPKSKVYKLVGPILINVDLEEAKENVGKRLEFIEAEVHKVDASIGEAITSLRILHLLSTCLL